MCFNGGKNPKKASDCGAVTPCKCDATVTIGRVRRGNPYVPRNANAADGMPDSVPPGKTYEVEVTVTWSKAACPGQHIDLSIINGSADNGTATVSPAQITATTTVTVTGGTQTKPGHDGQLKIQAKLDGTIVKAESAGFTVCAHPINYKDTFKSDIDTPTRVGMFVQDDWESDSGTFSHLDEAEISELVQLGPRNSPPFAPAASITLNTSSYFPADSRTVDEHRVGRPSAGPAGTLEHHQLCIFKCHRCGAVDKDMPNSGFKIIFEVFQVGTKWKQRTRKVGSAITLGARTSGAGDANAVSPDHDLP
jgi:hypothetical protein